MCPSYLVIIRHNPIAAAVLMAITKKDPFLNDFFFFLNTKSSPFLLKYFQRCDVPPSDVNFELHQLERLEIYVSRLNADKQTCFIPAIQSRQAAGEGKEKKTMKYVGRLRTRI